MESYFKYLYSGWLSRRITSDPIHPIVQVHWLIEPPPVTTASITSVFYILEVLDSHAVTHTLIGWHPRIFTNFGQPLPVLTGCPSVGERDIMTLPWSVIYGYGVEINPFLFILWLAAVLDFGRPLSRVLVQPLVLRVKIPLLRGFSTSPLFLAQFLPQFGVSIMCHMIFQFKTRI